MPIKNDLSEIPRRVNLEGGVAPVKDPQFAPLLAEAWLAKYIAEGNDVKPMSIEGRRFRASWAAARCDRELHYRMAGVEGEPLDVSDLWRMGLGQMVHTYFQDVLEVVFDTAEFEKAVDLRVIGLDGAASVDVYIPPPGPTDSDLIDGEYNGPDTFGRGIVIEVKTINGFGFKKAATPFKGPAEGPRWSAVVQGALAAAALDADLVIVYLSLENLSPDLATRYTNGTPAARFTAEWHIDAAQAREIALAEVARINNVLAMQDQGILPPRALHDQGIPVGAIITDPARKLWMVKDGDRLLGTGDHWLCGYCDHRPVCIADGEGGAPETTEF